MQYGMLAWQTARQRTWPLLVSGLLGLAGLTLVMIRSLYAER